MKVSPVTSLAPPLTQEGLKTLEYAAEDIALEVTNGYFIMHPECYQNNPERIKKMCKADLQHHFRFLLSAMATAIPEIFRDYSHWLKEVLVTRKLSLQHPIDSFELMKKSITPRLSEIDKEIALVVLDAGLDVFKANELSSISSFNQESEVKGIVSEYSQCLTAGDRKQAEHIIDNQLLKDMELVDISVDVIQPAMYNIGYLWQENKITVAQEHLATAISQNILARGFMTADFLAPVNKRVVSACIEGNHHCLGLRMINDTFEIAGWDASFLGADTPNDSILRQVDAEKPDVLALSVSLPHQVLALQQLMNQLRSEMGAGMPSVVVGGLAFNQHKLLASALKVDAFYQDAKEIQSDIR